MVIRLNSALCEYLVENYHHHNFYINYYFNKKAYQQDYFNTLYLRHRGPLLRSERLYPILLPFMGL